MLTVIILLAAVQSLTLPLFFIVSLIGLLLIVEVTAVVNVTPQWRTRLRWIVLLGVIGLAYYVLRQILGVLPLGLI